MYTWCLWGPLFEYRSSNWWWSKTLKTKSEQEQDQELHQAWRAKSEVTRMHFYCYWLVCTTISEFEGHTLDKVMTKFLTAGSKIKHHSQDQVVVSHKNALDCLFAYIQNIVQDESLSIHNHCVSAGLDQNSICSSCKWLCSWNIRLYSSQLPNHLFAHIPNRMNLLLALPTKIAIYVASHPISSILMHMNLLA